MRLKFGLAQASYDSLTVVVILRIALARDRSRRGRRLGRDRPRRDEVKPAPALGSIVDHTFLAGVATKDERMVLLLDIEKFLSSGELNLLEQVASLAAPVST